MFDVCRCGVTLVACLRDTGQRLPGCDVNRRLQVAGAPRLGLREVPQDRLRLRQRREASDLPRTYIMRAVIVSNTSRNKSYLICAVIIDSTSQTKYIVMYKYYRSRDWLTPTAIPSIPEVQRHQETRNTK